MKIHEYQAKAVFRRHGVPTPRGELAVTPEEARAAATRLGGRVVVKAQIHAGGRGKAGGVKLAADAAAAEAEARRLLGATLVTPQTGPQGRVVRRLLIEETLPLAHEAYLAVTVDRATARLVVIGSGEGGVDIEEVAARRPEAIRRESIDPAVGFRPWQARRLARGLGWNAESQGRAARVALALVDTFLATDASLAEINPLVLTGTGEVVALDAKMTFDDNALFRHPDLAELRDPDEEEPLEVEAARYSLNYVKLAGNVGCMVNGAGLAMATMDIIKLSGGEPANFLDVGGGASAEQVQHAFEILVADPDVRAVLINIFGGILRCDRLAQGVVQAARSVGARVPIVVRMEGTNVEEGRRILRESGLAFILAEGMKDAADKAVRAAGGRS